MRLATLFLVAAFAASMVGAASYQKTDGTIVDPILDRRYDVPDWHSEMDQAWRDSVGILAIDPTSGDINSDGVFDAADYTVWQDNGGDQIDYRTWKDNFGESIASGSGADHHPRTHHTAIGLVGPDRRAALSAARVII